MPTAIINQPHCRVVLKSERLLVSGIGRQTGREQILREIPIRDLDRLIVGGSVEVTAAAFAALFQADIPISYLSWSGRYLGGFLPAQNNHGLARIRQYQRTLDPEYTLEMARRVIKAKLYNQRRVLQRLAASRKGGDDPDMAGSEPGQPEEGSEVQATLKWLDGLFASVRGSRTLDELRGYEGAATARYFQTWAGFLPEAFPFERRSKRPPMNPVNACISFGATILYNEAVAFIQAHGLDPALGLLHATEDGRWSLALDLIEPFRPVFVEALALDLFSRQMVDAGCFEPCNGGIYLNEEGRRKFFLQYERRMERQFLSEAVEHRTTLRRQLEHQAVMYKAALELPEKFEPFLMN